MDKRGIATEIRAISIFVATAAALTSAARAEVCDYTPSHWAGKTATTIGTAVAGSSAVAGAGLQAAGYYTLVHAGSGLTMLGSTAAGASAAGTVGIIAGTAGTIGTAASILMAPVTIVVGSVTVVAVGVFEGACYFRVERVTDPYDVRRVIESVALQDKAVSIVSTEDGDAMGLTISGETETYLLRNLYIADGHLKYRDYGPNTDLGPILYMSEPVED
ncbi:hypothetical protein [Amaricoccus solimangrovi]|uniref:Uncharacterized protein n=1 Tax=Amaricoccus solimangrovi TaxID=2589815 RepID=A0A501WRS5_9RHOB|nr:hypothetical protein [Amaricoccus solimangrovi]TPE52159.1 hypothetical protein FJM51_06965 [Amaricoccus solimangrovi]